MGVPHGYSFHVKPDTAIANALEEDKLDHWGFVIYRCTYGSQEKWDKFLALAKQEARDYLERWGTGDLSVYDKMDWTVIEDAETLNGASILDATRKFDAWVKADGRAEMQHITSPDTWRSCAPRYQFFMYVDEESLESVVDDERARDRASGYFCKVVFPSSVFIREESRVAGVIPDDQDPLDEQLELLDSIKKIELGSLVSLYVTLLDPNMWYYIYVDVDYDHVGIALV
ncbi:hypothetical protein NKR19_g5827 [Coniochaeta hoffmannii]|uniref:Uncharacterized protein n=1 Tax=Coniochaeta hoffmannii TaxID=91930 RepID=A0AA38RVC6_9PEZI|nr:hypothetical protein NKR19_g5827 [Coniochaeta hoffmannii]